MNDRLGPAAVGLFGKYPGQGDFVRLSRSGSAFPELEAWIHDSVERMPPDRRGAMETPIGFVLGGRQQVAVGGVVASEDRVRRQFPLAIFATLEPSEHRIDFPALPMAFGEFLTNTFALLAERRSLDPAGLRGLFDLLIGPDRHAMQRASETLASSLYGIAAHELLVRTFETDDHKTHVHGLAMFVGACRRVRSKVPGQTSITLDCPAPGDVERGFWLAAARGLSNGGPHAPTFLWSSTERRLLLTLGPSSPHLLRLWTDPSPQDSSLWSVNPRENPVNSDIAERELSPGLLHWLMTAAGNAHQLLEQIISA